MPSTTTTLTDSGTAYRPPAVIRISSIGSWFANCCMKSRFVTTPPPGTAASRARDTPPTSPCHPAAPPGGPPSPCPGYRRRRGLQTRSRPARDTPRAVLPGPQSSCLPHQMPLGHVTHQHPHHALLVRPGLDRRQVPQQILAVVPGPEFGLGRILNETGLQLGVRHNYCLPPAGKAAGTRDADWPRAAAPTLPCTGPAPPNA